MGRKKLERLLDGKNPPEAYSRFKIIKESLEEIMRRNNLEDVPGGKLLRELGYSAIERAAVKYHGGFPSLRQKMGYKPKRAEDGAWHELDYTKKEALKLMKENNLKELPSGRKLHKMGRSDLQNAINIHHGGFRNFRKILGQPQKLVEPNVWKNIDYVIEQMNNAMDEHNLDEIPSQKTLQLLGYKTLPKAINHYHGGFRKFRERMGEKQVEKEKGYWKNPDNVVQEMKNFMKEHDLKTTPTQRQMQNNGYSSICSAIAHHHGGFRRFKKYFEEKTNIESESYRKPPGYWTIENVVQEMKRIVEENKLDEMPNSSKLKEIKCSYLISAIGDLGCGWNKFRIIFNEMTGIPVGVQSKPQGYWTLDTAVDELMLIMKKYELNEAPTTHMLKSLKCTYLVSAVGLLGIPWGKFIEAYHKKANIPSEKEQLEQLLEGYSNG